MRSIHTRVSTVHCRLENEEEKQIICKSVIFDNVILQNFQNKGRRDTDNLLPTGKCSLWFATVVLKGRQGAGGRMRMMRGPGGGENGSGQ